MLVCALILILMFFSICHLSERCKYVILAFIPAYQNISIRTHPSVFYSSVHDRTCSVSIAVMWILVRGMAHILVGSAGDKQANKATIYVHVYIYIYIICAYIYIYYSICTNVDMDALQLSADWT